MKQTAVEWLFDQLPDHLRLSKDGFEMLQQAKEMDKEHMIDFGYACANQIDMNDNGELLMVKSPKELYNEKYGGNNAE
jgi:hypothetical protein